jgi:hypothetical protein
MPKKVLAYSLVALAAGASLRAQVSEDNPLSISNARFEQTRPGTHALTFQVTNNAKKTVDAYVVSCRLMGVDGKAKFKYEVMTMTRGVVPSAGRPAFQPGETWTDYVRNASESSIGGEAAKIELRAVYVLFSDDSVWGDSSIRQAGVLYGMKQGARMERAALKRLLDKEGLDAVHRALRVEHTTP